MQIMLRLKADRQIPRRSQASVAGKKLLPVLSAKPFARALIL
jgi:hypothetical protein